MKFLNAAQLMTKKLSVLSKTAFVTALMMGSVVSAQAGTQSGDLHYTADCGVKELRMSKGSYSVNRAGAIKGDSICEYHFYAKKGQKVTANIIGSNDLYPLLYDEVSKDLSADTVVLDKTGDHTIRVLQPRNQARAGNTPKPFYLTVTIK